jgi:hypothetical protein
VWLIYNFYPFTLSTRFLRVSIKKIQEEKIAGADPYNKARETYHRAEIKVKDTHRIFSNWLTVIVSQGIILTSSVLKDFQLLLFAQAYI